MQIVKLSAEKREELVNYLNQSPALGTVDIRIFDDSVEILYTAVDAGALVYESEEVKDVPKYFGW